MDNELVLRMADTLLAVFWGWALVRTLLGQAVGGRGFGPTRRERPIVYWLMSGLFALMVLHFGGLALVGQSLD